jgi:6-pyruvoyltetrahydropterin/6-carboxytetrahydropterin synthase
VRIYKDFRFDAAHFLPFVPKGHKCGKLHGHTYTVRVYLRGPLVRGWVMDFGELSEAVKPVIAELDHSKLNDKIDNPTSEKIAIWIYQALSSIEYLEAVEVSEGLGSGAYFDG